MATALTAAAGTAQANEIKFKSEGGLKWETEDGASSGQLGGRVMLDGNYYDEDTITTHESGFEFRRLRLFAKTQYMDYEAKIQIDFADSDVALKDAYISKKAFGGKVIAGHFKQPFGLEELTSSKYITFMERSFSEIPASRRLGLGFQQQIGNNTLAVSVYDPDSIGDENGTDTDGAGAGGRFTFAPHADNGNVTHLGAAIAYETNLDEYRVRPRIGHLASRTTIMNVAAKNDTAATKLGLEGALVRGPMSVQAEIQRVDVDGGGVDEVVNAYYIYGSYFLTGDTRPYKAGAFGRVKPRNPKGAWEVALRYEGAENDDTQGEAEAWTLGLNYYATKNVRYMFNLVRGDLTDTTGTVQDEPLGFLVRGQLDF